MYKIVTLGEPVLNKNSIMIPEIDDEIKHFIEGMFETMYERKGIGLAAVQIGRPIRVFISHSPKDMPRVFINPEIIETAVEEDIYEEGCLSIPGINADITRPYAVKIQAWNESGRPFTLDADGLLARVIQHEYDHLNGILFIDRLKGKKKERLLKNYTRKAGA
ncbi:MAG: peptide deformylase [Spirochaetes bacterium]|nr:peptide deformylase [Spirochaetota bacterium]